MRLRTSASAAAVALAVAAAGCGEPEAQGDAVAAVANSGYDAEIPSTLAAEVTPADQERATGEVFRDCAACPEMVVVPAGTFVMGSRETEDPMAAANGYEAERTVTIRAPFAVGVHEVTFEEWDACVEAGGCRGYTPGDVGWGRGRRPVINVSWADARLFAEWLTEMTGLRYRLPTEAEWEHAARAGTVTARYWGAGADEQCEYANGFDLAGNEVRPHPYQPPAQCTDGFGRTAPVGSFPPNGFGLYDVLGNVWEWTEDCWTHAGAPPDGSAVQVPSCPDGRVIRGGSWGSFPAQLRSAQRRVHSGTGNESTGLRVVREVG